MLGKHLASVVSSRCVHIAGHGGAKKAVRDVCHHLFSDSYVIKSNAKKNMPVSTIRYCATPCQHILETGMFYVCFMDDWFVISPTR